MSDGGTKLTIILLFFHCNFRKWTFVYQISKHSSYATLPKLGFLEAHSPASFPQLRQVEEKYGVEVVKTKMKQKTKTHRPKHTYVETDTLSLLQAYTYTHISKRETFSSFHSFEFVIKCVQRPQDIVV